jgi:glyceraldehyde 3-phosphate dehydrogenase
VGMSYGSLFDATQTKITGIGDKQLVKSVSWYDNEMSFVSQLTRLLIYFGNIK